MTPQLLVGLVWFVGGVSTLIFAIIILIKTKK